MDNKTGMTLVEVIIAIAVLLTVSTAAITVVSSSMKVKRVSQDYSVATILSAEGIELVRQIRDTNRITHEESNSSIDWTYSMPNQCVNGSGTKCYVDATVAPLHHNRMQFCAGHCPELLFDSNVGYQYSSGDPSGFVRTIGIRITGGSDIMEVSSTVSWQDQSGTNREVVVRENLFDWE